MPSPCKRTGSGLPNSKKQTNLNQTHKWVPLLPLQDANKNTASLKSALGAWEHLRRFGLPQKTAPPPLVHDTSLDLICLYILVFPHLALPYSCFTKIPPSSFLFISQSFSQPVALNVFHIPLWTWFPIVKIFPEQPDTSRLARPYPKHTERKTSWLGSFFTTWGKQNPDAAN